MQLVVHGLPLTIFQPYNNKQNASHAVVIDAMTIMLRRMHAAGHLMLAKCSKVSKNRASTSCHAKARWAIPTPILREAEQDLLSDGAPNTPGRRYTKVTRDALSLRDLLNLYTRNHMKSQTWKAKHTAGVIMKIPALLYYRVLAGDGVNNMQLMVQLQALLKAVEPQLVDAEVRRLLEGSRICQLIVCAAKLGQGPRDYPYLPVGVQKALANELMRGGAKKLPSHDPALMSELCWALGRHKQESEDLIGVVAISAGRMLATGKFNFAQVSKVAWGFAKCGHLSGHLLEQVCASSLTLLRAPEVSLGTMDLREHSRAIANLAWALAVSHTSADSHTSTLSHTSAEKVLPLLSELCSTYSAILDSSNASAAAKIVWSLAKLNFRNDTLMDSVATAILDRKPPRRYWLQGRLQTPEQIPHPVFSDLTVPVDQSGAATAAVVKEDLRSSFEGLTLAPGPRLRDFQPSVNTDVGVTTAVRNVYSDARVRAMTSMQETPARARLGILTDVRPVPIFNPISSVSGRPEALVNAKAGASTAPQKTPLNAQAEALNVPQRLADSSVSDAQGPLFGDQDRAVSSPARASLSTEIEAAASRQSVPIVDQTRPMTVLQQPDRSTGGRSASASDQIRSEGGDPWSGSSNTDVASRVASESGAYQTEPWNFSAEEVAHVVWSFSHLGYRDYPQLFEYLAWLSTRSYRRSFSPQEIVMLAQGFAETRAGDDKLFHILARYILKMIGAFGPEDVSELAVAFAKSRVPHAALFEALGQRALFLLPDMSGGHRANLLWALRVAGIKQPHAELRLALRHARFRDE